MGQRTRMGRTGSNRPISRAEYRQQAWERNRKNSMRAESDMATGELPRDDAGGRARFAAKHAVQPRVKYERTEQSSYSGPKTFSPPVAPAVVRSFRKVGVEVRPDGTTRPVWRLIAAILGR